MPQDPDPTVTELLSAASAGDVNASDKVLAVVYAELKRLARSQLQRITPGKTLQPTALVNEAWLRLAGRQARNWSSRREYLGFAAQAMRDILVEDARRKASQKRGGNWRRADPDKLTIAAEAPPEDLLALDELLTELEATEPRRARVVHLRFFAGLTEQETADAMELSERTVRREWRFARMWFFEHLSDSDDSAGNP